MESLSLIAAVLSLNAPTFGEEALGVTYFEWLSNSMLVAAVVVLVVLWWARSATKNMQLIPGGNQNTFEAVVEFLYDMLEGIVGKHMVSRAFSLLATLFIFILFANWFSLLPGVGSIGWGHDVPDHGFEVETPLLRPTTADLNMTLGWPGGLLSVAILDDQRSRCGAFWFTPLVPRVSGRDEAALRDYLLLGVIGWSRS
jgi:F-type H+-transporting ATPase subunit a